MSTSPQCLSQCDNIYCTLKTFIKPLLYFHLTFIVIRLSIMLMASNSKYYVERNERKGADWLMIPHAPNAHFKLYRYVYNIGQNVSSSVKGCFIVWLINQRIFVCYPEPYQIHNLVDTCHHIELDFLLRSCAKQVVRFEYGLTEIHASLRSDSKWFWNGMEFCQLDCFIPTASIHLFVWATSTRCPKYSISFEKERGGREREKKDFSIAYILHIWIISTGSRIVLVVCHFGYKTIIYVSMHDVVFVYSAPGRILKKGHNTGSMWQPSISTFNLQLVRFGCRPIRSHTQTVDTYIQISSLGSWIMKKKEQCDCVCVCVLAFAVNLFSLCLILCIANTVTWYNLLLSLTNNMDEWGARHLANRKPHRPKTEMFRFKIEWNRVCSVSALNVLGVLCIGWKGDTTPLPSEDHLEREKKARKTNDAWHGREIECVCARMNMSDWGEWIFG